MRVFGVSQLRLRECVAFFGDQRGPSLFVSTVMAFGLSGCSYLLDQSGLSQTSVGAVPVLSSYMNAGATTYLSETSASVVWSLAAGSPEADSYSLKLIQGENCVGTTISTMTLTSTSHTVTGLVNGSIYSAEITGTNAAGTSLPVCKLNIGIDTQSPTVASFTTPAVDTTTSSTSYLVQWSSSDVGISGLAVSNTYTVQVYDAVSCGGTLLSTSTQAANSFTLSGLSNGNVRSARVTASDKAGNVSAAVCSSSVTANTSAATLTLSDTSSGSTSVTNALPITIAIGNDTGASKWCVSESQTTAPANGSATCNGGAGPSSGWYTTRPTTFTLSTPDASKTVHLWIALSDNSVSSAAVSSGIVLDRVAPTATVTSCPANPSTTSTLNVDVGGTGVSQYSYKLGIAADCTNSTGYGSLIAEATNITETLSSEGAYLLCVRGQDLAENLQALGSSTSCSWTRDTSGPAAPASLSDGTWSNSTTATPTVTWTASTDALGTVASYEMAIGTSSGGTQTLTWTDIGNVISYSRSGLTLTNGTTYYVSVRAKDNLGNVGTGSNGDGFTVDTTALGAPTSLTDGNFWNSIVETPTVTWVAPSAGGAPVSYYEFAIGSTSGGTQILAYTNIANVTSYQRTGLILSNETRYYISVRAVDAAGNTGAVATSDGWDARTNVTTTTQWVQQAYIKASNADAVDYYGYSTSVFGDTMVVGAAGEASNQTTITNGATASADNSQTQAGAVYVYKRTGTTWAQEAYIKASNALGYRFFGFRVYLFGDTLAVGATGDASNQTTITNGATSSSNNSLSYAGAVYVYKRTGSTWAQEAYVKASNAESLDQFGNSLALDLDTLVVGTFGEDSNQTTITNGTTSSSNNLADAAGAIYVYKRTGTNWAQEAYIKASNMDAGDAFSRPAIRGDYLAVGSYLEDSNQTTITNGSTSSTDNSANGAGAVYVYKRTGATWAQEAYIKASNAESPDTYGNAVALDGESLAVGAYFERSTQTTITNGTGASSNNSATEAGAVYIYKRTGTNWAQEAYIKASNTEAGDNFGWHLALSGDTLAVAAIKEDSDQASITNGATASSNNLASDSGAVYVYKRTGATWAQESFIKASNSGSGDWFGYSVSVDNDTLAVTAVNEDSNQTTITNGTTASSDESAASAGAAYIYVRESIGDMNQDSTPERVGIHQQAYIKASNAEASDQFGSSVSLSGDTLAVGALDEDSNQTTITNGTTASGNNSTSDSGAVYVYKRTGTTWAQEAYIKAANAGASDRFGWSLNLSQDTLTVGAYYEDSSQTTITNGTTASSDNSASDSGAVYVYKRTGTTWAQEAYVKAANANAGDQFGNSISISGDTLTVGAFGERSNQTTITNGTSASSDNSAIGSGAVYVYKRSGTSWAQEAYIKAVNSEAFDYFGYSVSLSGDTLTVGAYNEDSSQTTITNGTTASSDNLASDSGAVYVYKRTGIAWAQEAYIKAANVGTEDRFGWSVSVSGDTIAAGALEESSNQTTITNGTTASSDDSAFQSGAVYVYKRTGTTWVQEAYIKAANAEEDDRFGYSVSISGDTLAVGAVDEDSNQTTISTGATASSDNSAFNTGAVYLYRRAGTNWVQRAYIKAANSAEFNYFGYSVSISGDTLAVGAIGEDSNQTTITNGTTASTDNSVGSSGAAYVYRLQWP